MEKWKRNRGLQQKAYGFLNQDTDFRNKFFGDGWIRLFEVYLRDRYET